MYHTHVHTHTHMHLIFFFTLQLHCTLEGVNKIVEIDEKSTCNYTLTVHSPLLCQHPMLVPLGNSAPSHTLSCAPVVSQLDYEDYLLKQGPLLISCYTVCDMYTFGTKYPEIRTPHHSGYPYRYLLPIKVRVLVTVIFFYRADKATEGEAKCTE